MGTPTAAKQEQLTHSSISLPTPRIAVNDNTQLTSHSSTTKRCSPSLLGVYTWEDETSDG